MERCVHVSFRFRLSENIWNKEACVEQRRMDIDLMHIIDNLETSNHFPFRREM